MRVLVTGGTGHLGTQIVSELCREGRQVRVLARRPGTDPDVDWVIGDLSTGDGIVDAVAGVDVIVHAATNSPAAQRGRFTLRDFVASPADVDIQGTKALLAAARTAGVAQFVHVSIVGLDALKALPYSRRKLAAEQLVRDARVPWSIVRATGFYWLLARMFAEMVKRPMIALPAHALMAPVDSDEFARFIVDGIASAALGEREDFAGPQTSAMTELMAQYLAARRLDRRIRHAPLPRRIQNAITAGNTAAGGRRGTTTWEQWLKRCVPVAAHDRVEIADSAT